MRRLPLPLRGAPGFPVTITQPGSYHLDGNLTLPDVYTNGINIQADNVTIDLNGFSIIGPNVCVVRVTFGVSAISCSPGGNNGTGIGIYSANNNHITIHNGKIQGTGAEGVDVGGSVFIEGVQVRSMLSIGIKTGPGLIKDCITDTINNGFYSSIGQPISHVVARNHPGYGIGGVSLIVTNSVVENALIGLYLFTSSYSANILEGNAFDVGAQYSVNTGQNICENAICP
jgi:hypothetical protein